MTEDMPTPGETRYPRGQYVTNAQVEAFRTAYNEAHYHLRQLARSCKPVYDLVEPRFQEIHRAMLTMRGAILPQAPETPETDEGSEADA